MVPEVMPPPFTPSQTWTIDGEKLLLVEGNEEARFWPSILAARGKEGFQVLGYGGKDNLENFLRAAKVTPGFADLSWLGVMRDADLNAARAFRDVRRALRRNDLPFPARPWRPDDGPPIVTVFILPDGEAAGDLEDLVWRAVAGEGAVPCVEHYFGCLQAAGVTLPRQLSKARVHAYLSSLPRPDLRLGNAAESGQLETVLRSPVFDRVLGLLP